MREWKEVSLGDFCSIGSSKRIFYSEYTEAGVPFWRSKEVIVQHDGGVICDPLYISEERYAELEKYGYPSEGDLLLTSVGTIGVPYLVKANDRFYFKDGNLTWFKDFSESLDSKFLYLFLESHLGQSRLEGLLIGSSQKALTISALNTLQIPLPPIETQKRIAEILFKYGELIENNRRQIALLEEAAHRLYKEWFVDLRFPGHETTPIIDGLPEGWGRGSLFDLCTPIRGCSYSSEEVECGEGTLINLGNLAPYSGFRFGYEKPFSGKCRDDQLISKGDVFIGLTEQAKGLAGYAALVPAVPKGSVISADLMRLIPLEGVSSVYLYGLLRFGRLSDELSPLANGTKIKHLRPDAIARINFVVPPIPLINKYGDLVSPFFEKVSGLEEQITSAREARDRLLPKLMSGEIEVV